MAEVIWTPRALKDISEIAEYIAKDSLHYAEEQVKQFFERATILENYPLIGRPVPEIKTNTIRQILCGRYRIVYEVINESLVGIVTIHHQSRLLKNNPALKKYLPKKEAEIDSILKERDFALLCLKSKTYFYCSASIYASVKDEY